MSWYIVEREIPSSSAALRHAQVTRKRMGAGCLAARRRRWDSQEHRRRARVDDEEGVAAGWAPDGGTGHGGTSGAGEDIATTIIQPPVLRVETARSKASGFASAGTVLSPLPAVV